MKPSSKNEKYASLYLKLYFLKRSFQFFQTPTPTQPNRNSAFRKNLASQSKGSQCSCSTTIRELTL